MAAAELKIIRVELKEVDGISATGKTYEKLHAFMKGKNWLQTIVPNAPGSTFARFDLPTAMYCGESSYSAPAIAEALKAAIEREVWPNVLVLVMGVGTNWGIR